MEVDVEVEFYFVEHLEVEGVVAVYNHNMNMDFDNNYYNMDYKLAYLHIDNIDYYNSYFVHVAVVMVEVVVVVVMHSVVG